MRLPGFLHLVFGRKASRKNMRPEEAFDLGFEIESIGGRPLEEGTITSVGGISAGAASAGMRRNGLDDVALVVSDGTTGAGVFTRNKAKAAPVVLSMKTLEHKGPIRAIVANAGCANALTGSTGMRDAETMQQAAADAIASPKDSVLVASTGLIGTPLASASMASAIASIELSRSADAGHRAARAIMTTDTIPKECAVVLEVGNSEVTVGGIAKGAAMLAPSMATMLAFIATDVALDRDTLRRLVAESVSKTFNRLSVDSCMSTNDCVLALATSTSGVEVTADRSTHDEFEILKRGFEYVCASMALSMARDAEGSSRLAVLRVRGAASPDDAERVGRAIAASSLVRCSLYGGDAYWGRVVSEAGAAASVFDVESVSVSYGPFEVCSKGVATESWESDELSEYMSSSEIAITCDLGVGTCESVRLVASLGPGYVEENMRTS
jgi:glutamate N-acetyltransferase/amino-acid N-acetyltransferase